MAIIINNKFKAEIDQKAIGLSLPIRKGNDGYFESNYETRKQIQSNLRNLLLTQKGERIGNVDFGCNLKKVLFEPLIQEDLEAFIQQDVESAVATYLPYVTIESIDYSQIEDEHKIELNINYSLNFDTIKDIETINLVI